MDSDLSELGHFANAGLLIMTSLAIEPRHGYAMMQDVQRSYGVHLGPGTLYTALSRLEEQGLIEPVASDDRRRPYRLTEKGTAVLRAHLTELQRFAASGLKRLASS